jgi:hypothetical protein
MDTNYRVGKCGMQLKMIDADHTDHLIAGVFADIVHYDE